MNEIKLSKVEILLLKAALRSTDGIFIGGITTKLGIAMSEAVAGFRSLRKLGFLKQQGSALHLTSRGRGWIMANQNLFAFKGDKAWREVPEHYRGNTIRPFEPYAPRLSKLSKAAFGIGQQKDK